MPTRSVTITLLSVKCYQHNFMYIVLILYNTGRSELAGAHNEKRREKERA